MDNSVFAKKEDCSTKLLNLSNEFLAWISANFPEQLDFFENQISDNVTSLLSSEKPKIMVYGIYNSGKSTLVNALCKENVAEVADRPMTYQITEYDRGDYYLVDSPGINAPEEHEIISDSYLNKCHIIIFVASTKGMFEDRKNYERLAHLIQKGIPFIIVLNDRGFAISSNATKEEKEKAKLLNEQELKNIQYKFIKNLTEVSNDNDITKKYEVIVVNAKKALIGIQKNLETLYESSNIEYLNKRISQLLNNNESIKNLFAQPINNLRESFNYIEKLVNDSLANYQDDDTSMRIHTLRKKCDNIIQELRITVKQCVFSTSDLYTNSILNGDADSLEIMSSTIFEDVDRHYAAKLNDLLVYINKNFPNIEFYNDSTSNLSFDYQPRLNQDVMLKSGIELNEIDDTDYNNSQIEPKKFNILDIFKSSKQREEELRRQLEAEAEAFNERERNKAQILIQQRQEARQIANTNLCDLENIFVKAVANGINEKYDEFLSQILEYDSNNKQALEEIKDKLNQIKALREKLLNIETQLY